MTRFSIITVCFNAAAVIDSALQSLQAQTFSDYEWLVIDGGSTDHTLDIVRRFEGFGMRVVSESDDGIYDAMNKGVAMAKGEYLFFLNADDTLAGPGVLAAIDQAIRVNSADLIIGRIIHVTSQRRMLRDFSHISPTTLMMDTLCHQAVFARRDWFAKVGVFDLCYRMAADYDWFLRSFRAGCSRSCIGLVVCVFSGEGAHQQAQERTRFEIGAVRERHAGVFGAKAYGLWRRLRHYLRRLTGRAPQGFLPA